VNQSIPLFDDNDEEMEIESDEEGLEEKGKSLKTCQRILRLL